jgi:hypothetical protein
MEQETDLTRPLIAEIVGMSRPLVDMWLRPRDTPNYRFMPDRAIRLLEFELGYRKPSYTRFHRGFANMPLKENSTLWCIVQRGKAVSISDQECLVKVTKINGDQPNLATLSNGAVIDVATLRGYLRETKIEDRGAVKEEQPPELQPFPEKWISRKVEITIDHPVRCWRTRQDWEAHVITQRAWNKLASRIQTHSVENMEDFTVDDIESAELALFGNIQK